MTSKSRQLDLFQVTPRRGRPRLAIPKKVAQSKYQKNRGEKLLAAARERIKTERYLEFGLSKDVYSTSEVMELFNISRSALSRLIRDNEISAIKFGRSTKFLAKDLVTAIRRWNSEL
jgi:excisionase family DNA binding protein